MLEHRLVVDQSARQTAMAIATATARQPVQGLDLRQGASSPKEGPGPAVSGGVPSEGLPMPPPVRIPNSVAAPTFTFGPEPRSAPSPPVTPLLPVSRQSSVATDLP